MGSTWRPETWSPSSYPEVNIALMGWTTSMTFTTSITYVTDDHARGGFNSSSVSSRRSGGQKSKIQVSAKLVPLWGLRGRVCPVPLLQLLAVAGHSWHSLACGSITQVSASLSRGIFPVHLTIVCLSLCVCVSLIMMTQMIGLGPTLTLTRMTLF